MEGLPPGFRFYPTEEELVGFYLKNKLESKRVDLIRLIDRAIPTVDIYDYNSSDLPRISEMLRRQKDPEQWIFFVPRRESKKTRGRPNRLTAAGYWKATGSSGFVYSKDGPIGGKRTMVFYAGRAPTGTKTEWRMNEYTILEPHHHHHKEASSSSSVPLLSSSSTLCPHAMRQKYSICRVYTKSSRFRSFDRRPPQPPRPPPRLLKPVITTHSQPHDQGIGNQTAEIIASQSQRDHHHSHASSSSTPSEDHDNINNFSDETIWGQQLDSFLAYFEIYD